MNDLKILCPFCNEVWTAKMINELETSLGYDTFGPDGTADVSGKIKIECSNCHKIVYIKEVES